jgi:pilus assembly protein CpaB
VDPAVDAMTRRLVPGPRQIAVFLLALAAGLLSAWAVREHVRQRVETLEAEGRVPLVSRLVAAHDLAAGTVLEDRHLAVRDVPAQWAPASSLEPGAVDSVLGMRLAAALPGGELVLNACLAAADPMAKPSLASRLEAGQRAFVVPAADLGSLAAALRVGDAIDVYLTLPRHGQDAVVPVLRGVRVLTAADGLLPITLAASVDQITSYLMARRAGALTAVLRDAADVSDSAALAPAELMSLLNGDRQSRPAPRVVILYGDRLGDQAQASSLPPTDPESEFP